MLDGLRLLDSKVDPSTWIVIRCYVTCIYMYTVIHTHTINTYYHVYSCYIDGMSYIHSVFIVLYYVHNNISTMYQ